MYCTLIPNVTVSYCLCVHLNTNKYFIYPSIIRDSAHARAKKLRYHPQFLLTRPAEPYNVNEEIKIQVNMNTREPKAQKVL